MLKNRKNSIGILGGLLLGLVVLAGLTLMMLFWIGAKGGQLLATTFILLLMLLALVVISLTFLLIYAIMMLRAEKKIPPPLIKGVRFALRVLFPFLMILGKLLGYHKNVIRNAYTKINNHLVLSGEYSFLGNEIMILTPHCLQNTLCDYRVTQSSDLCRRCGKCNVDDLLGLTEKYGVQLAIATGGTLARRKIMDIKPKAVVAVACERDLISGLQDVRGLPVIAVVNQRPEGPCVNTKMDIEEVEKGILHFLKEELENEEW